MMELGLYTFGDMVPDPATGRAASPPERMRQMMDMARLADEAGLDVIGVGEHHGLGYVNSATAAMIAGMAAATRRIRLTSASTLISTADPVRTFQEFATADLVSEGRVEIVFGRGAFLDNFPLFGFNLDDYDALFVEKVALFERLNAAERVTWSGRFRPALDGAEISPRPAQPSLPVWIGAGRPATVSRAAAGGYPVAMPILGGSLTGYAQTAQAYRQAWADAGHDPTAARLASYAHLHVAESRRTLNETFFPYYSAYLQPLFKGPMPREQFDQWLSPQGSLVAGEPQAVVDKILAQREAMGITRFMGQIDIGGQPWTQVAKGVERFATIVAPAVRDAVRPSALA